MTAQMSDYQPIIGIECHVQLDTATKLFCRCPITDAAPANASICPTCTGQPGTLPALNEVAVRLAIRAGLAIGCTVQEKSIFARKNYFYPDLPKGYQITQFDAPICTDGKLHVFMEGSRRVFGVTRLHMEEDAGKMIHGADGSPKASSAESPATATALECPLLGERLFSTKHIKETLL